MFAVLNYGHFEDGSGWKKAAFLLVWDCLRVHLLGPFVSHELAVFGREQAALWFGGADSPPCGAEAVSCGASVEVASGLHHPGYAVTFWGGGGHMNGCSHLLFFDLDFLCWASFWHDLCDLIPGLLWDTSTIRHAVVRLRLPLAFWQWIPYLRRIFWGLMHVDEDRPSALNPVVPTFGV
ncbi:hypothetical protein DM860_003793 [Cuscuta australis]|uniref:Uncharacterized protein n=1 Tax=Cuscuta australis TaxID=267555 RepID=A0A328DHP6_9ASTE|nr:hypothetical protein DM860_003793 [Cuscuta australis]